MRRSVRAAAVFAAALGVLPIGTSVIGLIAQDGDTVRRVARPVRGSYLVMLRGNDDAVAVAGETAVLFGGRVRHVYPATRGFAIRLPQAAARALARDPRIAFVEEDGLITAAAVQRSLPSWGLDRIDQRNLPLDDRYRYSSASPRPVNIHVIDSGIRLTHVEFGGRAFIGGDFVDDDQDEDLADIENDDADSSQPDGIDCFGHGTTVAGVAAGHTVGVAKHATVWSYRVIDCLGIGTWSAVIGAVEAISVSGARPAVVNISLTGGTSTAANLAIRRSIASGVTYVVAAGNQNDNAANYSPAKVAEAIVVGATTAADQRHESSNWGGLLDLFAPGEDITSASQYGDSLFEVNTGTSMAAPHVAGVAALILENHPFASPVQVGDALVRAATRDRLADIGAGSPDRLLYSRPGGSGPRQ